MVRKAVAAVLVSLLALVLGACGQQETGANVGSTTPGSASATPVASGMDHGTMPGASPGMDHGHMGPATGGAPYDAQFIDSMIEHHEGAITMAQDALKQSQRAEIKQLAQNIIDSQQQEIEQMTTWRQQWYPGLAPTGGMGMDMGDMTVGGDAGQPYDQRFITAMIAHHNGAIAMAQDALTRAEHPEIKQLAQAIITAQESEVAQMQQWQKDWFGTS